MPADQFMRALPHYYGVELHNFSPNSIALMAGAVVIEADPWGQSDVSVETL